MHELPEQPPGGSWSDVSVDLRTFADHEPLRLRVLKVLRALPEPVKEDLFRDPRFHIMLEQRTGNRSSMWIALPSACGNPSRCVVLRARLSTSSEAFACYVIAHELAHAFLRNGGWGHITDREEAADAMAATWGFDKPR